MPIRKDLLHLYKTPEYLAARERIKARAGNCCEQCGKPNGIRVETKTGHYRDSRPHHWKKGALLPYMFWRDVGPWRDWRGELAAVYGITGRFIRVVLTLAHLDHNPVNNSDDNLKFLCQWCHLNYDKLHHAETRSSRKDRERPLLTRMNPFPSCAMACSFARVHAARGPFVVWVRSLPAMYADDKGIPVLIYNELDTHRIAMTDPSQGWRWLFYGYDHLQNYIWKGIE